jgi:hypothetical protein
MHTSKIEVVVAQYPMGGVGVGGLDLHPVQRRLLMHGAGATRG